METFVTDEASNNSWANWNTTNVSVTVKWTTGSFPKRRQTRDILFEGLYGELSRPSTSKFFNKNCLEFTLLNNNNPNKNKHILRGRVLLREKNDINNTAKKENRKRDRSLAFGIYFQCCWFAFFFFSSRALTHDITRLVSTVRIIRQAQRPTDKKENTIWSLITV